MLRLPKGLEKTVLGIASSLIILGTPTPSNSQENRMNLPRSQANWVFPMEIISKETKIKQKEKDIEEISMTAVANKNIFGISFGMNDSKEEYGRKIDVLNLYPLDLGFSKLVFFLPKKVEIKKTEQKAYVLPQRRTLDLKPIEETVFSKKVMKWGENLIDSLTPLPIINPIEEIKEGLIDSGKRNEEKEYAQIAKKLKKELGEEYTFQKIDFFPVDATGCIERGRAVITYFDTEEVEGPKYARAMFKPAVGRKSNLEGAIGDWVEFDFLIYGDKLPPWVKKSEIDVKEIEKKSRMNMESFNVGFINSLAEFMKEKNTGDIAACFPEEKRIIMYSFNPKRLGEMGHAEIREALGLGIYLSIYEDLKREKLPKDKGTLIVEARDSLPHVVSLKDHNRYLEKIYKNPK